MPAGRVHAAPTGSPGVCASDAQGDCHMTRKLRRRLRVIAARATVCAVMVAAMGATGWRTQADVDAAEATQASLFAH